MLPVRNRLVGTRASSRLYPYLTGRALIADPLNENPQLRHRGTLTITEALDLHADHPRPWRPLFPIHNDDDRGLPIRLLARMSSCVYCGRRSHTLRHCPNPHALCHNCLGCIIPSTMSIMDHSPSAWPSTVMLLTMRGTTLIMWMLPTTLLSEQRHSP